MYLNDILNWNKITLSWWNQMLQPWMESKTFAQGLGNAIENSLVMYMAFRKIRGAYAEELLRMMKIASTNDALRIAEQMIHLENKVDLISDEIDHLASRIDESRRLLLEKRETGIPDVVTGYQSERRREEHEDVAGETNNREAVIQ